MCTLRIRYKIFIFTNRRTRWVKIKLKSKNKKEQKNQSVFFIFYFFKQNQQIFIIFFFFNVRLLVYCKKKVVSSTYRKTKCFHVLNKRRIFNNSTRLSIRFFFDVLPLYEKYMVDRFQVSCLGYVKWPSAYDVNITYRDLIDLI